MSVGYQREVAEHESNQVQDALELFVSEGARKMLAAALEEEVSTFLGRVRYERRKVFKGYRNGYHPARQLARLLGSRLRADEEDLEQAERDRATALEREAEERDS